MSSRLAFLQRYRHETILFVVVMGEWLLFNSIGPRFGSADNTFDIVRHSAEIALLALALTPIILTGGIDLSVGSTLGLCAVLLGKLLRDGGLPLSVAIPLTLLFGAVAGAINAGLIVRLKLPPLIVTLGTFSLFRGLAEALTRGVDTFTGFPNALLSLGQERVLGVPSQMWVLIPLVVGIFILVHQTTYGRTFRIVGFSPGAARFAGLSVERRVAMVYILAGVAAALAAIIYSGRVGQARADAGTGYELAAIAAVVLGGTSIFGGRGSIVGTLLGVGAIALLHNGLVHARLPRELAGLLTGVLLLVALAASSARPFLGRLRSKKVNSTDPSSTS